MTDSAIVKYSGDWIFYQGIAASGATLTVYNAGSVALANIFTDAALLVALANPVTADSGGLTPFAYIGTQNYKVVIKTASGTTIDTQDDIPGAVSTAVASSFAIPVRVVRELTSGYTAGTANIGEILNCTPSTTFTVTLGSAATFGDGKGFSVVHSGTANQVKIVTSSGQSIVRSDISTSAFALVGFGHAVDFVSDGANWIVVSETQPGPVSGCKIFSVVDRISAAPSSPTPGALYIVTAAFSTFEQHDLLEADGQGGFIEHTPTADAGWFAYVMDEDTNYQFQGSSWVAQNIGATTSVAGTVILASQAAMEAQLAFRIPTADVQKFNPTHPKAWINFNGTGTISFRNNVGFSSITDIGVGVWDATQTTAMSSDNYAVAAWGSNTSGTGLAVLCGGTAPTTTVIRFTAFIYNTGTSNDIATICGTVLGDQ